MDVDGAVDDAVLECFLDKQLQLFPESVAETMDEAEDFLEECMAVVVDSVDDVIEYFDEVTKADYAEYDYLIGMDSANIRNMLRIFGGDPDGKVARLLSYAGSERDISDPWYTGEFGTTYNDVLEGCTAFLRYLQQNGRIDT
jgi:protein-tyrosine-phosphatase